MKQLTFIRHGEYTGGHIQGDQLTEDGKEKLKVQAENVKKIHGGGTIAIMCSPATRCVESAHIIASAFDTQAIKCQEAYPPFMTPTKEECEALLGVIETTEADHVVVVTHSEYLVMFPVFFFKHQYGVSRPPKIYEKGEGFTIDCVKKRMERLLLRTWQDSA